MCTPPHTKEIEFIFIIKEDFGNCQRSVSILYFHDEKAIVSSFIAALALLYLMTTQVLTCTEVIKGHETSSYFAHAQLNSYLLPHLLLGVEPETKKSWNTLVALAMMRSSTSR